MPIDSNGNEYEVGLTYRLRAGSPIYDENGNAFLHTFGAELNEVLIYDCIKGEFLPSSDDFMGQGGQYMSANFSKIGDKDDHFQGRIVKEPIFVSEGAPSPGVSPSTNDITFIECSSINISYDIMGLVSVSYTVVSNSPGVKVFYSVSTGKGNAKLFSGFPVSISHNVIPNTTWYETHVTLMAVTAGGAYSPFITSGGDAVTNTGGQYPDWWYRLRGK